MTDLPRPFNDIEYALIVQNDIKRFVRLSAQVLSWIHPRHWAQNEPDRRQVTDAIDLAIEALQQQMRGNRQ